MKIRLHKAVPFVLSCALGLPLLMTSGCADAVATDSAVLSGTYTGSAAFTSGAVTYRLNVPFTNDRTFPVTGTVVEGGETYEVRGTGTYDKPNVAFELVRAGGTAEDVFGISGSVSGSNDRIRVSRQDAELILRRD